MALAFYAGWKMGKLNNLKIPTQIARVFSLSIEATGDNKARIIDDADSHHDLPLSLADLEYLAG